MYSLKRDVWGKRIKKIFSSFSFKAEMFQIALLEIQFMLHEVENDKEKLNILQFLMKCVINDICASYAAKPIYCHLERNEHLTIFPSVTDTGEKGEVDFTQTPVLSFPWESKKFRDVIRSFANIGFDKSKYDGMVTYFKDLNFAIIMTHYHSTAAASVIRQGTAKACIMDLTTGYERYTTDGAQYFLKEEYIAQKKKIDIYDTYDYRFAVLFVLGQMQYDIQKKQHYI